MERRKQTLAPDVTHGSEADHAQSGFLFHDGLRWAKTGMASFPLEVCLDSSFFSMSGKGGVELNGSESVREEDGWDIDGVYECVECVRMELCVLRWL